jgi:zinc/manganese transport system permease protein
VTAVLGLLSPIVEPGFIGNSSVRVALVVGAVVALVSGTVGVFTVMRGQSFTGHALADLGSTGGSAAFLLGISPLFGFVGMGLVATGAIESVGARRRRGQDLAAGIVLGAGLGLAALFLYWDTTFKNTTGATINVLFGSIFSLSSSLVPVVAGFGALALALVLALYRPLVLSALGRDLAAAAGVRVRLVSLGYLLALTLAVSLSAVTIGAVLSTALLIGPAATALRMARRLGVALVAAGLIGVAETWIGVLLSWDSYFWGSTRHGWPVSFFVVSVVLLGYLGVQAFPAARRG